MSVAPALSAPPRHTGNPSTPPASPNHADEDVVERMRYDAYGACTVLDADFSDDADNASDVGNPYTYTARHLDAESRLMQYRHRNYSVNLGRFVSRDPIQDKRGDSFYVYVGDRPTVYQDHGGEVDWSCCDKITEGLPEIDTDWGCVWDCMSGKDWSGSGRGTACGLALQACMLEPTKLSCVLAGAVCGVGLALCKRDCTEETPWCNCWIGTGCDAQLTGCYPIVDVQIEGETVPASCGYKCNPPIRGGGTLEGTCTWERNADTCELECRCNGCEGNVYLEEGGMHSVGRGPCPGK
jgi:RHS repeat-associated protein